ncbi:MAG TPA: patatin-like phospholipase family protein [Terriglobales bacterium]
MSRQWFRNFLSISLILAGNLPAFPAESTEGPKKIGLVLEGGGALGLAHIGVLQWLEEHRIPVSYVAGTSMGGLVGGMYAVGNSPEQIHEIVNGINWDEVLAGQVPYRDLAYRRKEDAQEYPNNLEFGIRNGIRFPEGFNSGHQVGLILDRVALPYGNLKSFDELPIPFGCVATDLVSGEAHIFRGGSLALALRSTMSLPGIFTPIRTKKSIYADGGLLDNLPVDVALDMGADFTIAIHLETKDVTPNQAMSSFGVLSQSISVVIAANELKSMEKADILVSVPLQDYTTLDYNKADELIKKGYDAAASKAAILSAFSVDEATWQQYIAQKDSRKRGVPTPEFVKVKGTTPELASVMEEKLASDVGKPVDTDKLDNQLTQLLGNGRFSRVGYSMIQQDGKDGLQVIAVEKEYGPPLVRPLVVIDGSQYNNIQFLLGARITFLDLGGFGSEWRNDITLGSEYGVTSEFYRPWGHGLHWFVAPRMFATDQFLDVYDENKLVAEYRNRQAGGNADIGYRFNSTSELRFGYLSAYQSYSPSIGTLDFEKVSGRLGITSLRYNFLGADDPVIPTKGLNLHFFSGWYDASPAAPSGYPVSQMTTTFFKPITPLGSLVLNAAGGTTLGYHQTGVPPFSLGGNSNFTAYGDNEFLTDQYFLFKAGYLRKLASLPPLLGGNVYAFGLLEAGRVYDIPNVSPIPMDASASIIVNTIFGPVLIGGAYGATGHHKIFFGLGRVF